MSDAGERSCSCTGQAEASGLETLKGRTTCSIDEAARILGIGRSTAYAAAHDGTLPVIRVSKRLLVPAARLAQMLEGTGGAGQAE
jgi:excisionase family DNA binding protein